MFDDTKGIIKICKSKKDRQHNGQKKKNRQHNGQKKNDKRISNGLQDITQKTKDRATRTLLSSCSTCGTRRGTLVTNPTIWTIGTKGIRYARYSTNIYLILFPFVKLRSR